MAQVHASERRPNEVFVGNHNGDTLPEHVAGVAGARLGDIALDLYGNLIPKSWGYRPLFVDQREGEAQYDRIMMARMAAARRGGAE